jgi:hypothetical protein
VNRTRATVLFGLLALVGAAGLLVLAAVVPGPLADAGGPVSALIGLGLPALAVGLLALLRAARGRSAAAPPEPPARPWAEEAPFASVERFPGATFDQVVDIATDPDEPRDRQDRARRLVRGDLRGIAVRRYRQAAGCDAETARRAVDRGTWTDDPWAGSLLAESPERTIPWGEWLWATLAPGSSFRRQVERTVDAVEALEGSGRARAPASGESADRPRTGETGGEPS